MAEFPPQKAVLKSGPHIEVTMYEGGEANGHPMRVSRYQ